MLVEAAVVLDRLAPASHPALLAEGEERVLAHAPGLFLALHDDQSQHRHLTSSVGGLRGCGGCGLEKGEGHGGAA
jgi:hypothetical protein